MKITHVWMLMYDVVCWGDEGVVSVLIERVDGVWVCEGVGVETVEVCGEGVRSVQVVW